METKTKSALVSVIAVCGAAVIIMAALCAMLFIALRSQAKTVSSMDRRLEELMDYCGLSSGEERETSETGVEISGGYKIMSTKNISDSYINGDSSELGQQDGETLSMASEVLETIITEGMSDYEKEEAVYLWMCENISNDSGVLSAIPTSGGFSDRPYGALKYRNAVCVGFSTTFRLLMNMIGIDCMVVHNTELYHTWNLVKIDGQWYHTDTYSDSGAADYSHFNLNDSMMSIDQEWDTEYFPSAESFEYNYMHMHRTTVADVYDVAGVVSNSIEKGIYSFAVGFEDPIGTDEYSVCESMMMQINTYISEEYAPETGWVDWNWYEIGDDYYLSITVKGLDDTGSEGGISGDITYEQQKKIDEAIAKAFGISWYNGYSGHSGYSGTDSSDIYNAFERDENAA